MKMIKIALLGTAALAAVSVSARADTASDIAALKAQVEALSAQVAATNTEVPAGFQLVSVSTAPAIVVPGQAADANYAATATTISVVPTADAPASTVVQWSGFVRAALVYTDGYTGGPRGVNVQTVDVLTRSEIKVTGTTDTAVGEVGATVKLRAQYATAGALNRTTSGKPGFSLPGGWGWWKMTPELTLGAGLDGSLAGIGYGYDGACSCYYTDNANAGYGHERDPAQFRLTYASGPMSAAIALEDEHNFVAAGASTSALGVAAEIKYAGDTVSGEVSGGYWPAAVGATTEAAYQVGMGVGFSLGDMAKISAAAGIGSGHNLADNYWKASILGSMNMSDSAHVELAYNHVDNETAADQNAVLAGIYYEPVSQLTIGLEAEWIRDEGIGESKTADLVTVFRF